MSAYDILYWIGTIEVVAAILPAHYIVWKYHRNLPWQRSRIGWSFMGKAVAIALVLDLALIGSFFRDDLVWVAVRTAVFGFFVVMLYWQAVVMTGVIADARTGGDAVRDKRDGVRS